MHVGNLEDAEPFITKDGSSIRELAGRVALPAAHQSLAEATIPPGTATDEHYHPVAEELYFLVEGTGRMRIEADEQDVGPGDCIVIPPGARHKLFNTGTADLRLLCCCAPAYSHDDTVITEGEA